MTPHEIWTTAQPNNEKGGVSVCPAFFIVVKAMGDILYSLRQVKSLKLEI